MAIKILDYESFPQLLEAYQKRPPRKKKPLTLAEMARRLGYKSPRAIAMLLNGKRSPNARGVERLSQELSAKPYEKRFIELLVKKNKDQGVSSGKMDLQQEIELFKNRSLTQKLIETDDFVELADWPVLVLKQLIETKTFQNDPFWISKKLGGRVCPDKVTQIFKLLEQKKIIEKTKGRFRVNHTYRELLTEPDKASLASRKHHAQMLQQAVNSLILDTPLEREFISLTTKVDPNKMSEVKAFVRNFVEEFNVRFSNDYSEEVYQLCVQFFPHTRKEVL